MQRANCWGQDLTLINRLRFWAWRGTSVLIFLRVFVGKAVAKVDVLTGPERIANPNYPLDREIIQLQERFSQIDRNITADILEKETGRHFLMLCKLKNIKIRMER
jgi:hypothetical protein